MDNASPAPMLQAIPYDQVQAAEPPKTTSTPFNPPGKKRTELQWPGTAGSHLASSPATLAKIHHSYIRRDSGLAPSTVPTASDSRTTLATDADSVPSPRITPSLPTTAVSENSLSTLPRTTRRWGTGKVRAQQNEGRLSLSPQTPFERIATEIPTGSLDDLTTPGQMEFSNRGSVLLGGRKVSQSNGRSFSHSRTVGSRRFQNVSVTPPSPSVPTRIISTDDELLSHKVRSMYESGMDRESSILDENNALRRDSPKGIQSGLGQARSRSPAYANGTSTRDVVANGNIDLTHTIRGERGSLFARDEHELAGGMEDWEDLDGSDVDRYGFIVPKRSPSPGSSQPLAIRSPRVQRVTTSLQVASDAPRRHRGTARMSPSSTRSTTVPGNSSSRSFRPSSRNSQQGSLKGVPSKIRTATNWLSHNKDRRAMDEAADMLTLPPGLADIAEDVCMKAAAETKRKEWEREDKWRKMAKVVNNCRDGGGMMFEFDTSSPKLIERTWKGIPDRWRATAWHAFMTASAKKRPGSPTDEELIRTFQSLVDQTSPDDVQIDIDVPRTINSHIMFRRRYRGGQRLLFRVLHCLSIYFPDTGYVQGMAALAATLLCYFDEEMAFVMLVRLWQLRGLERLYQPGFEGLMQALEEFEKRWLGNRDIAVKLVRSFAALTHVRRPWLEMLIRSGTLEKPQCVPHRVRHPLVPHPVQLLHSLSRSTPHLGRFHASRRLRPSSLSYHGQIHSEPIISYFSREPPGTQHHLFIPRRLGCTARGLGCAH
jgi:hypothetical protein